MEVSHAILNFIKETHYQAWVNVLVKIFFVIKFYQEPKENIMHGFKIKHILSIVDHTLNIKYGNWQYTSRELS